MDIEQIKNILERYKQGQCTAEEANTVEAWFDSINRHQSTLVDEDFLELELEEVRQNLQEHIHPKPIRSLRPWYYAAIAAAIVVAAVLFLFKFYNGATPPSPVARQTVTPSQPGKSNRVIRNGYMEITTARGGTERIALADGSTIMLNASSKLRYPVTFSPQQRDIYLDEGEAFFTVAKDPQRQFTVHTAEIATTALGTSFNIRAYAHENKITVALLTGKVKIDKDQHQDKTAKPLILLPSEQVSYDRISSHLVKTTFSKQEDIIGWKQGLLVFKDASYNEVITEIENRYGVTIVNQSDKTEWKYNGFFKDESLQDVIETICISKSLSYTIKNDTIYLENKN
ncbi:FecR family protein [Chitinophaga defluvii]|uniref:FecR domain-containing protein n=1 Tax=Chitinophaga defluvii TaxID=3163343 RepID=A0ABV2TCW2_9BACT